MPEVAGEGTALIIDPFNPDEIVDAMQRLVEDQMLAKVLSEKGVERAKDFSWESMARHVLNLYENVYEEIKS